MLEYIVIFGQLWLKIVVQVNAVVQSDRNSFHRMVLEILGGRLFLISEQAAKSLLQQIAALVAHFTFVIRVVGLVAFELRFRGLACLLLIVTRLDQTIFCLGFNIVLLAACLFANLARVHLVYQDVLGPNQKLAPVDATKPVSVCRNESLELVRVFL
jgi:hypothetical protein